MKCRSTIYNTLLFSFAQRLYIEGRVTVLLEQRLQSGSSPPGSAMQIARAICGSSLCTWRWENDGRGMSWPLGTGAGASFDRSTVCFMSGKEIKTAPRLMCLFCFHFSLIYICISLSIFPDRHAHYVVKSIPLINDANTITNYICLQRSVVTHYH